MMMKRPLNPDFHAGVDRKDLKIIRERFLFLAKHRLQRTKLAMTPRQQLVLDILPLLFHVNHPLLPGYVSLKTPHLIGRYEPDKEVIDQAQRLSRAFHYRQPKKKTGDIVSVFLMGSTGSVAHSTESDMDVWLCYRDGLSSALLDELAAKAERISHWAAQMGAELHIFLMNAASFRQGRDAVAADEEDCGTAQHFLLLDEFYRTSIWLAGAYPLWWLIPPDQENDYSQLATLLRKKRFIRASDYIDFGGCAEIPPPEFVGAGLWQLYKGIDSPYKSFLKLKLIENYTLGTPSSRPLCLDYKAAVFNDELNPDALDPYVMIYRRLELSLSQQQPGRKLELVRRCFYLKVDERLSQRGRVRKNSWRQRVMKELVKGWEWKSKTLQYLDSRAYWRLEEVIKERRRVVSALIQSYRFLSDYARDQGLASAISARDIHLLGRKLTAVFQRKAGKIEMINPHIAPSLAEEKLSFHHLTTVALDSHKHDWRVYRQLIPESDIRQTSALKRSNSLVELILWAHINGLLTPATSISLTAGRSEATLFELRHIISRVRACLSLPLPPVAQQDYLHPAKLKQIVIFVNVGKDPMAEMTRRGLHKLSDQSDALGYASSRTNLVLTLDQVITNNWNEVRLQRYEAGEPLVQCLSHSMSVLREAGQYGSQLPHLKVYCFCPTKAAMIAERVQQLFNRVIACFFEQKPTLNGTAVSRYLLQIAQCYYVLQFDGLQPQFLAMKTKQMLEEFLGLPVLSFRALEVDEYALQNEPLDVVLRRIQPNLVQIYLLLTPKERRLFISDERGSLISFNVPEERKKLYGLLGSLCDFLYKVKERQHMVDHEEKVTPSIKEIAFYRLVIKSSASGYRLEPLAVRRRQGNGGYFAIQATEQYDPQGNLGYSLSQANKTFSVLEYGSQTIEALARDLQQSPSGAERKPGYITDLSLPLDLARGSLPMQSILYLKHKFQLEEKLAMARSGGLNF